MKKALQHVLLFIIYFSATLVVRAGKPVLPPPEEQAPIPEGLPIDSYLYLLFIGAILLTFYFNYINKKRQLEN